MGGLLRAKPPFFYRALRAVAGTGAASCPALLISSKSLLYPALEVNGPRTRSLSSTSRLRFSSFCHLDFLSI